jgi:hypothetical protein
MGFDVDAVFRQEFDEALADDVAKSGFPLKNWFRNGMTRPEVAAASWRDERGPESVRQFIRWYESSDHKVWITPDGRPALELELRVTFGEIPVVMYIDLITESPAGLTIIDYKSGWLKPHNPGQLGFYACGVELAYGREWRPLWGAHFLTRGTGPKGAKPEDKTYFQPPEPLDGYRYSVPYFTRELGLMEQAVDSGLFLARPGSDCDRCGVAYACPSVGGSESHLYDPSDPGYVARSIHP